MNDGATPVTAVVNESAASINTACQVTILVTDDQENGIYLNVDRIIDVIDYVSGDFNSRIYYNFGGAEPRIFTVEETRSQIRTAANLIITAAAGVYAQTNANNEWTVYQVFDAPNQESLTATKTALAGGAQGGAGIITKRYTNVTTCATAGDSVTLMTAPLAGQQQTVKNNGATTLAVFPTAVGAASTINGGAINASVNLNPGDEITFTATTTTNWETPGTESLGVLFISTDIHAAKEIDHIISVDTTTTAATVGGKLTMSAGAGATSGIGGILALNAGAGGTAGAGGAIVITSGAATNVTSTTGAATGAITITTGVGATATTGTGSAGGLIRLLGAAGGAATGAAGIGGVGAATTVQSGAGGASSSATGGNGGAGGAVTVQSGVGGAATGATATGGAAGAFAVTGGAGGAASDNSGVGTTTGGAGSALTVTMGAGGALGATNTGTSGAGGAISLTAGAGGAATAGTSGAAGVVSITAGASGASTTGTGATGGAVTLTSGAGALASAGGLVSLIGGAGGATGIGGGITITSGAGGSTSAGSGAVNIKSGTTTSGTGGLVLLGSGNATTGTSGTASLTTGTGTTASGAIAITTGTATTTGGSITLSTGNTSAGNSGSITLSPGTASAVVGKIVMSNAVVEKHKTAAINATATMTATQAATGYITSTSAAATVITLPTGTLLGAELGAVQGTVFELYIDNTAGASTVTIAVAVNGILSDAAATTAASFGQLTVAAGVTGQARFTLMFSSATAYTFTRSA